MKMKGVVLAGGLGTRLYPLTYSTNKHLLPVYDRPMVFYPIQTLVNAGVDEIMIVTGGPHAGHFLSVLKNGKGLGLKHLEFAYQEGEGGIPVALSLAEDFADGGPVAVILGDNTTDTNIAPAVKNFRKGATVFLKKVTDPQRFGVAVFNKKKEITRIEEKPKKVFDIIRTCKPSARGELEITEVNNVYLKKGELRWSELKGFWSDAGTFESLFRSSAYWAKKKGLSI